VEDSVNLTEEFRSAMASHGLNYAGPIYEDGKLHRVKCEGDSDNCAWYVLHPANPVSAGAYGCWKRQIKENWCAKNGERPDPQTMRQLQQKWKEAEAQRARDEIERHRRIADTLKNEINSLPVPLEHDYLTNKQVGVVGDIRLNQSNDLVLPLVDSDGKLWGCQTIDIFGDKLFYPGARVSGCFYIVHLKSTGPLIICEGFATGVSIHTATGWSVLCAMNCGNLSEVSKSIRKIYPNRTLVIAADDDRFTKKPDGTAWNPGLEKATAAAEVVKAKVVVPKFREGSKGTDFNDMACEQSIPSVRRAFDDVLGLGMGHRINITDLVNFIPEDDSDCVIGNRYLCRGGSCVIVGETSAGKSALGMQMAICFALGLPFMGMKPKRPLKSLIIQAENDIGDTAEMFQGILIGMGLIDAENKEQNSHLISILEKNLIIVRDQTHVGRDFAGYASKMVELHQPDLFWCDPLLSFFGDDINNQQSMSNFLRAELNPISERTGIVWMMMHHTGKPSKEAKKYQKGWSSRDFAYLGIGSSELSNWARAIITLVSTGDDEFRMILAKRGIRAGIKDGHMPVTEIHLAHSGDHICWKEIPKPKEDDEMNDEFARFAKTIDGPMQSSDIVRRASLFLKRGERTVWRLWGKGSGKLAEFFEHHSDGIRYEPIKARNYDKD
jgi:phage/plasmid primase-like uncharacterized protein